MTTIAPSGSQRQSPLEKARAEGVRAREALDSILEQNRALMNKRALLGQTLTREGKLSRAQRSELGSVNRQLRARAPELRKAQRAYDRVTDRHGLLLERKRVADAAADEKRKAAVRVKVGRKVAQFEASSRKRACFARLPIGAKPSKGTRTPGSGHAVLEHGYVTREGRGKSARWVLVVTDSYQASVLPLDVSNERAVRECFIPAQVLKAVDKAGAFRITKNGIQPLKVTTSTSYQGVEVDGTPGYPRVWAVEKVGTGYLLPEAPGKFPDHRQVIPKAPAKANSYRVRLDPALLKRVADVLGADNSVELTFDLSKAGKASAGRRCRGTFLVANGSDAEAAMAPVRGPDD